MARPKGDGKTREKEKRQKSYEKISQKARERLAPQVRESEAKIRLALRDKTLTFTELKKACGLSNHNTFRMRLNAMVEREEIIKLNGRKGYMLAEIRNYESLEFFTIEVLSAILEEKQPIDEFNQWVGSFVTYTLKNYELHQATQIITTVLTQVGFTPPPSKKDQHLLLFGTPATPRYQVEAPQWALWKAVDTREYITSEQVLKESEPKKSDAKLPCSGKCVCRKASDGCMNRLIEAQLKDKTPKNVLLKTQNIRREHFDYEKFKKEWINPIH